jgi:hypothetical protein
LPSLSARPFSYWTVLLLATLFLPFNRQAKCFSRPQRVPTIIRRPKTRAAPVPHGRGVPHTQSGCGATIGHRPVATPSLIKKFFVRSQKSAAVGNEHRPAEYSLSWCLWHEAKGFFSVACPRLPLHSRFPVPQSLTRVTAAISAPFCTFGSTVVCEGGGLRQVDGLFRNQSRHSTRACRTDHPTPTHGVLRAVIGVVRTLETAAARVFTGGGPIFIRTTGVVETRIHLHATTAIRPNLPRAAPQQTRRLQSPILSSVLHDLNTGSEHVGLFYLTSLRPYPIFILRSTMSISPY